MRALQDYLADSGVTEDPLFRAVDRHGRLGTDRLSDKAVALVVKRRAEAAGLDPARYAGHSLRSGLATSAAAAGVSERAILAQSRTCRQTPRCPLPCRQVTKAANEAHLLRMAHAVP